SAFVDIIQRQDRFERFGRLRVVEELLVEDARPALEELDFLSGRCRDCDLSLEIVEQLAVASGSVENAIKPPQRVQISGVERKSCLISSCGFAEIVELVFVEFGQATSSVRFFFTAEGLRAPLKNLRVASPILETLIDTRKGFRGFAVSRVLLED